MDVSIGERLEVLHSAVPGRVRLSVPNLKNNPQLAAQLEHRLRRRQAIQAIAASFATGNVTLIFDPSLGIDAAVQSVESARSVSDNIFNGTHSSESWWASATETVLTN